MGVADFTTLANRIDRLNTAVGRAASWCALAIVLIGFAVVLMRYVLGLGSIWLQESILYAHDILTNHPKGKIGVLCLAPEEGLGIDDHELRQQVGEDRITLFRRHGA